MSEKWDRFFERQVTIIRMRLPIDWGTFSAELDETITRLAEETRVAVERAQERNDTEALHAAVGRFYESWHELGESAHEPRVREAVLSFCRDLVAATTDADAFVEDLVHGFHGLPCFHELQLIEKMAAMGGLEAELATRLLRNTVDEIHEALATPAKRWENPAFGALEFIHQKGRVTGRVERGDRRQVPDRVNLSFRPAPGLKRLLSLEVPPRFAPELYGLWIAALLTIITEKPRAVALEGLGKFAVRAVPPRKSKDPTTRKTREIPAHRTIAFLADRLVRVELLRFVASR